MGHRPAGLGRSLAETIAAWFIFVGGSLVVQRVDHAIRFSSVAEGQILVRATVKLSSTVFFGAHLLLGAAAVVLGFHATRSVRSLGWRLSVVLVQAAIGFVLYAFMMIGYSCGLGDCL